MHVKGPIWATSATLIDFGWSVPLLCCWTDDLREEFPCVWNDTRVVCCLWQKTEQTICRQQATSGTACCCQSEHCTAERGSRCSSCQKNSCQDLQTSACKMGMFDSMVQGTLHRLAHASMRWWRNPSGSIRHVSSLVVGVPACFERAGTASSRLVLASHKTGVFF